jgi:arylsulfatase A-like enzyme
MAAAAAGRPRIADVLFIVLDDTGFGQLGSYGSPIATPHLNSLAADGLRYNRMHTTALCSPSRSCVITGRNHHSNGVSAITELSTGYPGYDGNIPFENGFLSEMLQQNGYTYMVGKWHLMSSEQESAAGALRPLAARPRLRPLLRVPRRRHQPVVSRPDPRQPPRGAPAPRGGATTSPRASPTTRSRSSPTPSRWPRTSPSTCISAPEPHTPRTTSRRNGPTGTPGGSTRAGRRTAGTSSRSRSGSA